MMRRMSFTCHGYKFRCQSVETDFARLYQITLQTLQMFALIPIPSPSGEGSQIQSPSPPGRGLKAYGMQEKGEGRSVDP
jgi:hypothetical protein